MTLFDERYKKLNPEQKKAVDSTEGPVMVIAGPGSGKTEVLGLRVANILKTQDVGPGNILCLTFTDAAAFNMRDRLIGLIGPLAYRVAIHTFHSFGVEIINRYPERFYDGASFSPADNVTQVEVLEEIFKGLEHNNPLSSKHDDQFLYLFKVLKAIENIKKAGLTAEDFKKILEQNKKEIALFSPLLQKVFDDRISKKIITPARNLVKEIQKRKPALLPGFFTPFLKHISDSLSVALDEAEESGTTLPITQWKNKYIKRGDDKLPYIVDALNMEKFEALCDIYEDYIKAMHEYGYYDYSDMILETIGMLEKSPGVRHELQERYQYILVDEFQDTNNAQMRLLSLLSDHPVYEGKPNIMVVGDDDQAIYKFQGAEISNIRDFEKMYRNPILIALKQNYRSSQQVLDVAREVIIKGSNQLEKIIPALKKELVAAKKDIKESAIQGKEFLSREAECQWIVKEVQKIKSQLKEIAIIGREHKDLEALVPYFHKAKIAISYEREENVLFEPHIGQIITMARFVDSIMKKSNNADDLLPKILSYPFWGIDRFAIFELSMKANKERKPWVIAMRESGGKLKEIADFFIDLGSKANFSTFEEIIHELVGGPQLVLPEEDGEDEVVITHKMFSPFRSYYFGKKQFNENRAEYLKFLSSLQSFMRSLREYRKGQPVGLSDMIAFVDMHISNKMPVNNVSHFVNDENSVQFMTAHKAKGLEFDAVFVINCENDVWANEGWNRNFPLPSNLPIGPANDNKDDQIRLFYVAITRAKSFLYFTSCQVDQRGKPVNKLEFLTPKEGEKEWFDSNLEDTKISDVRAEDMYLESLYVKPFVANEKALFKPVLEKYQLSVTHLHNFLNVADAGPLVFLEKNLLMFPEPKTVNGAFGTAVHSTIKRIYSFLKKDEKLPNIKNVLLWFEDFLALERLNQKDFKRQLKRGQKALKFFYKERKKDFLIHDVSEFNFKDQGAVVGQAALTGKIDKMSFLANEIVVSDFKTGKVIQSWNPHQDQEKIKAWKYRGQILFYKLLIENSRDYANKFFVKRGVIEFIEPAVNLEMEINEEEVERLKKIIDIVYQKIQMLDFPDITKYSKDFKGIMAFENDLLKGEI